MENAIEHRDIKCVTGEARKNYLVSVSNYLHNKHNKQIY